MKKVTMFTSEPQKSAYFWKYVRKLTRWADFLATFAFCCTAKKMVVKFPPDTTKLFKIKNKNIMEVRIRHGHSRFEFKNSNLWELLFLLVIGLGIYFAWKYI